ncbi:hypothetical protein [Streptomyces bangladeshensis]|uniref:Uncharacterized protein n=1 Tax=Streptomyces bangladeshensis TaxID=295352 RepID=A0ABP5NAT0_9ACTN
MPTRRTVLAGTATAAALAGLPAPAHATPATDHLGRDDWSLLGVEAVTGDPRVHGRVHLATDGRGIQYGEPV